MVFRLLADDGQLDRDSLVEYFWNVRSKYDFSPYQMDCDDALVKLGLARLRIDPEYPNEPERMFYGPPGDDE